MTNEEYGQSQARTRRNGRRQIRERKRHIHRPPRPPRGIAVDKIKPACLCPMHSVARRQGTKPYLCFHARACTDLRTWEKAEALS